MKKEERVKVMNQLLELVTSHIHEVQHHTLTTVTITHHTTTAGVEARWRSSNTVSAQIW